MSRRTTIVRGLGISLVSVLLCAIFASELPELLSLTDNTANDFTMRSPIPLVSPVLDGARNVRKATIKFEQSHEGLAFRPPRLNRKQGISSPTPFYSLFRPAHIALQSLLLTISANRPFQYGRKNSPSWDLDLAIGIRKEIPMICREKRTIPVLHSGFTTGCVCLF